ncbi:sortase [Cryobacterium sp. HLT2-28]|uniref:sortase n=1 Tax=Cryobacterium sp. HLT2-28 TaxID=1259146 RepID=UPI00106BAC37|nr:sortase [Cryobacterium sp. HLT2-28]TFB95891.1 sortase [Cryobacterium sp. HLT2-28]
MIKKTFAVVALAALALFAVPAAANAAGYVANDKVTTSGAAVAGGTVTVNFAAGSFTAGENVMFSVSGSGTATLSVFKAATVSLVKAASSTGAASVAVKLPADATGSYTVTATGATSANVGTATITVAAADAGTAKGLAHTGYEAPMLLIWGAAGALMLGIALVVVMGIVRRQRANA